MASEPSVNGVAGPIFAGLCATLVGVGLQRFAYAPLLPAMVRDSWLSAGDAGLLGAVNFAGYLGGALLAPWVGRLAGTRAALRGAMLLAALGFALCGWQGGFLWFAPWRGMAGAAGGVLMVLAGPAVQAVVPPARRGLAAGLTFSGIGLGIIAGAVLVPAVLPVGLAASWLALATVTGLLAVASWRFWPDVAPPPRVSAGRPRGHVLWLVLAYALGGVAATPHMGWWPDFIARGLGRGAETGAAYWLLYGVAVIAGTGLTGSVVRRLGAARALRISFVMQAAALALPLTGGGTALLLLSTVLAGAFTLMQVPLVLVRAAELAGGAAPAVWRTSTIGWAAAQTVSGFGMAWLYSATGSHLPLFGVGFAAALLAALVKC